MKKLSVAILLALALVLTFAACRSNGDDENGSGDNQPPAQETQPDPTPTDPTPTPSDENDDTPEPIVEAPNIFGIHAPRDFDGRTLRIQTWFGGAISFTEALHYDEPDPATSPNYPAYRMRWDNFHRVQEEFNFTLEEVMISSDYMISSLQASVMAGAPIAELVRLGGGHAISAILGDLIVPISGVNLPGSDILGAQQFAHPMVEFQGDIWTMNDSRPDMFGMILGVNLDIINAVGAPNPVDLYNAGQWNWEAMLNIMRLATADTTGDGTIDRFGLGGHPTYVLRNLIGANDGILVTEDLNFGVDHPNTIEAFEFFDQIFAEGLYATDADGNFSAGDWGANFWASHGGQIALFNTVIWGLNNGDLPFDFAIVPWPAGPSNTSGATGMSGWREGVGIVIGSDWDSADALTAIEEFYAWSGGDIFMMHEDALNWPRSVFPSEEDVIRVIATADNSLPDLGLVVGGYADFLTGFTQHFFDRTALVSELVETIRGPQQELLDNFFR